MNDQLNNSQKTREEIGKEEKIIHESERKHSKEAEGIGEVNVKNASASGNGSLERSDNSLTNNNFKENTQID